MPQTPWLPPSDTADTRSQNTRTGQLERRPQFTQAAIPVAVIGGTPRANGYQSVDSTTLVEIFRCDAFITAPAFSYDFQLATVYGSGVTSINYQIEVRGAGHFTDTVVVSGSGTNGQQILGTVDLFDLISTDIYTRLGSFRLSVSRNGGSGEGAAVRLDAPFLLRSPSILA